MLAIPTHKIRLYWQLMRAHQPVGVWLLFWPTAWAIALTAHSTGWTWAHSCAVGVAMLGAFCMRSAGCIINDLTDKNLDTHVARTATRPLASGALHPREALLLALLLTSISAALIIPYGVAAIVWAMAALPLVVLYPRMKRITWWPQAFLGLTFNWGALLGCVMLTGTVSWPSALLYIGGIFWTLGYDTIYAYQDKDDDALIGIRSSARALGDTPKCTLATFYAVAGACWASAIGIAGGQHVVATLTLALIAAHFAWQLARLSINNTAQCGALFRSNVWVGWLMFAACLPWKWLG